MLVICPKEVRSFLTGMEKDMVDLLIKARSIGAAAKLFFTPILKFVNPVIKEGG